jgi:hypothetical protein
MDHGLISTIDLIIEIFLFLPKKISIIFPKKLFVNQQNLNCHKV